MPGLIRQQPICDARDNAKAGPQFDYAIIRTEPAPDQFAFIPLIIVLQKAGAVFHRRDILGDDERATVRFEPSAFQIEEQSLSRLDKEFIQLASQAAQLPPNSSRQILSGGPS